MKNAKREQSEYSGLDLAEFRHQLDDMDNTSVVVSVEDRSLRTSKQGL